tara:strand:+ start:421 stop:1557 length:1137 start_codon:yes stop_codon:yes gene_type:complete
MGFFTNKVKSVIKQKIASNLISGFQNAAFGQPKKLAAKLASKSPLDMSQSPVAHMEQVANPYNYGVASYPQETTNLGDGHYIIFDVIENKKTSYGGGGSTPGDKANSKAIPKSLGRVGEAKLNAFQSKRLSRLKAQGFASGDEKILRNQASGINSKKALQTHTRISDSIILYTPPAVKFDYKVGYEQVDTGIVGTMGGFFDGKGFLETVSVGGDVLKNFLESVSKAALEIALPGLGAAVDKGRGFSQNPNSEMVFKSVPFRSFNFPYEFAPKNEKEKDEVQRIIEIFKFHMMPEKRGLGYLTAPSQFQITYMYRDGANMYVPKISRCALTDMSIDYSPEGVFTTFKGDDKGAAPVLTKVELTFSEMEIMTKETIAVGH